MYHLDQSPRRRFRFDAFEADTGTGELRKNGERVPIQDVPFRFLVVLLEHPRELVSREELRERIWPKDINLDFESALDTAARKVRRALGDSPRTPYYLETLPGHGYRFLREAQVDHLRPSPPTDAKEAGEAVTTEPVKSRQYSRPVLGMVAAGTLLGLGLAGWLWHGFSRESRILRRIPEITRLVDEKEFLRAAELLRGARSLLPKEPILEKLWLSATVECSIETDPPGAMVSIRPCNSNENAWVELGRAPLRKFRIPRDYHTWRIAKDGFATRQILGGAWGVNQTFRLDPQDSVPPDMVRVSVSGKKTVLLIPGLRHLPGVLLDDFLLDRTEVTNADFKKFVDAGGYARREYWKQPFLKSGKEVPWGTAVAGFNDATGRSGPATWEVGTYPKGQEKHPVAGVSWYEAAAYAEFVGKSLPTVFHWNAASQSWAAMLIVRGSNFRGIGPRPVGGVDTLGGFGSADMAGNVKEWCWNESQAGDRYILGGGFGEPPYMFIDGDAQSPWDRRPNFGIRCAKLPGPPAATAMAKMEQAFRDYGTERPVSDEVFFAFKRSYAYDRRDLNAKVEERETTEGWIREKVSFDAAYGSERVIAHIFLPKNALPPFQTVVWFPYSDAIIQAKLDTSDLGENEFVMKSGRALIVPIYKGMYERQDELKSGHPESTAIYRDHMVAWAKDLGRSLDYIETRPDLDSAKRAYLGRSLGARIAPILLALDSRFRTAILVSGGLRFTPVFPESDPFNYLPHVNLPVLMLNGRYDYYFPVETSQVPFLRNLGTPGRDKRHVLFESVHAPPSKEWIHESLDWLEMYLGPVKS